MLGRDDFGEFFDAAHRADEDSVSELIRPYRWQERLLDHVLENGAWPQRLVAPTGSGKTSVIDVHVFAQAMAAQDDPTRSPRRLSMVVDRRVLVDDQYEYAKRLAARLRSPSSDVLKEVAAALRALREIDASLDDRLDGDDRDPLIVARLRGGTVPDRSWLDDPTAVAVICATPDMWGSRLLFRGYGSSRLAWPREAGLLAVDSVVVVDEAHLSRQLVTTARRVAELVPVGGPGRARPWRPLQVVETTATPTTISMDGAPPSELGVDEDDLEAEDLKRRLTRPKPVRLVEMPGWEADARTGKVAALIADEVVAIFDRTALIRAEVTGSVGCFVNTVRRAVAVASALGKRSVDGRKINVAVICGQVRPADLHKLRRHHPGLLSVTGDADVDVIISTQSLEVGVDLDLAGIVTDLASGSALAQRAGRVNRRGLRNHGEIVVAVPAGAIDNPAEAVITEKIRSGPYDQLDLHPALEWIKARSVDPSGLAPLSLRTSPPPPARQRRQLFQRPELGDVWLWARTNDHLAVDVDLKLWLADDFELDLSAGLVVRDRMPVETADAIRLIRALPPQDHEVFSIPVRVLRNLLVDLKTSRLAPDGDALAPSIVVYRGGDALPLEWSPPRPDRDESAPRVRAGDVVLIDSRYAQFRRADGAAVSPAVPATGDDLGEAAVTADEVLTTHDVRAARSLGATDVLRIEPPADPDSVMAGVPLADWSRSPWSSLAATVADAADNQRQVARKVRDWLGEPAARAVVGVTAERMHEALRSRSAEVIVHRDLETDALSRIVVRSTRKVIHDEERRQEWLPVGQPVLLEAHQAAVGRRAAAMARALNLGDGLEHVLRVAGEHHDDGKRDERFQRLLGATDPTTVLAKSGDSLRPFGRQTEPRTLPARWRHEQLSAVLSWDVVRASETADPDLVVRLIGTTHGRGRPGFPHTSADLLLPNKQDVRELAARLFDDGDWDALVERTELAYGPWGCAYLEAVLRGADGQVSMEGS